MSRALSVSDWQKLNTSYCKRFSAWITVKACEVNRDRSVSEGSDLRCNGCNGLYDQVQVSDVTVSNALILALSEVLEADVIPEEHTADKEEDRKEDFDVLDNAFIDEDDLDEELAVLLPEYAAFLEEAKLVSERRIRRIKSHKTRKIAVYMGRCRRCGGFMVFSPERQFDERDVEAYRCISCSWRTSPVYEWNRKTNSDAMGSLGL